MDTFCDVKLRFMFDFYIKNKKNRSIYSIFGKKYSI